MKVESKHTIENVITFINKYKGKKAFPDSSDKGIMNEIVESCKDDTYAYAINDKGDITGIVTGTVNHPKKIYFLRNIVVSEYWVLKSFIEILFIKFPGYTVSTDRRGRERTLSPKHLINVINKL